MSNRGSMTTMVGKLRPKRNTFDLSYRKTMTCNMAQLIPVVCDECVPGDYWKIGNELTVRMQPLASPLIHEIKATVHYFFVPYRILWKNWESFISQGIRDPAYDPPTVALPRFPVPNINYGVTDPSQMGPGATTGQALPYRRGSLWDYFGMPLPLFNLPSPAPTAAYETMKPMDMPWRAYANIVSKYYLDLELQQPLWVDNVDTVDTPFTRVTYPINRNWRKDYFTVARPRRERGLAPAMPVNTTWNPIPGYWRTPLTWNTSPASGPYPPGDMYRYGVYSQANITGPTSVPGSYPESNPPLSNPNPNNQIGSDGTANSPYYNISIPTNKLGTDMAPNMRSNTFGIADLRLAAQLQKWMERNERAGVQYTEFLTAHFGVSPSDARLQRPEYIGGTSMPVVVSEILQTSATQSDSPQGNMSGRGLGAAGQYAGDYNVQEYGLIMGLLSVMPKPSYQNGMNRQWLRYDSTDFYFPEFAHLSEQIIHQAEIFYGYGSHDDRRPFGLTGQYDEMRVKPDVVCGEMRAMYTPGAFPSGSSSAFNIDQSEWNLARKFVQPPRLNSDFITCYPRSDIYAMTNTESYNTLIVSCKNILQVARPMPEIAEPGMLDHF